MSRSLFSNGSEYRHWQSRNCDRCTKSQMDESTGCFPDCELAEAIADNAAGIDVPPEIQTRLRLDDLGYPAIDCKERIIAEDET